MYIDGNQNDAQLTCVLLEALFLFLASQYFVQMYLPLSQWVAFNSLQYFNHSSAWTNKYMKQEKKALNASLPVVRAEKKCHRDLSFVNATNALP